MRNKLTILGDWRDELQWCPSQLYLKLEYNGVPYLIYCRWRHQDPWTAELLRVETDYKPTWDNQVIALDIGFFKDEDYPHVKTTALKQAKRALYSGLAQM